MFLKETKMSQEIFFVNCKSVVFMSLYFIVFFLKIDLIALFYKNAQICCS